MFAVGWTTLFTIIPLYRCGSFSGRNARARLRTLSMKVLALSPSPPKPSSSPTGESSSQVVSHCSFRIGYDPERAREMQIDLGDCDAREESSGVLAFEKRA